jgi:hypothetical protein
VRADEALWGLVTVTVLVMPEPDTACPDCWRAEQPAWLRNARMIMGLTRPSRSFFDSAVLLAAMGVRPKTWYQRHREDWERLGGQPVHLERMLRHVGELAL